MFDTFKEKKTQETQKRDWKKEINENGASWVNERQEDINKKSKWKK